MSRRPDPYTPPPRCPVVPFAREEEAPIPWREYIIRYVDSSGKVRRVRRRLFPEDAK